MGGVAFISFVLLFSGGKCDDDNGGGSDNGGSEQTDNGGSNQGGSNNGGSNQGGNQGGSNQGGSNNGGSNQGGNQGGNNQGGNNQGSNNQGSNNQGGDDNGGPGCAPPEDDNGGSDNGGSENGGSDNGHSGGSDSGGSDSGGSDSGGSDNGGSDNGGSDNGDDSSNSGGSWENNHFRPNKEKLEGQGVTAIPEDPTADTDEDTVDALFQDFGDRPGVFDAGDAQAAFDKALQEHKKQLEAEGGTYKPGDKIPRKVLAQALCTGLESCDDSVSVDDQIVQLYGDPDEHADEGSGITAGYGNRPDNSEESLIDDFGGENTASNGHIVAFLSRIDEIAAGGNGGDSDNSGGNHGNSGNYGNSGGNHGNSGNSGNTGSTPQTPSVRPVVSLSPQSRTVDEDSATTTFTVRLSRSSSQTATVIFFTEDGTATSGDDYEARAALVRFDPGETRAPVEVTIHNDPIHENNETFTARLALPQNANLSSSRSTVTIRDDDPAGFVGAVTNLTGQCVDGQITVSWSPPSSGVVDEYRYNIWDHPAMVGGRYGNRVATGTTTTNTYATATAPDPTVTYYAEVQARGGANPNQAGWLPTGGFTCTESLPVVSLDDTTLDVTEGQAVTIYASLTKAPSGTAHVWLSPPSANGGTIGPCTSSSDWAIDEGRFRFLGRSTSASITFTACPDSDTVDETVTLSLTTIDINGLALGEPHTIRVTITIIDNGTGGGQGGQDGWRV